MSKYWMKNYFTHGRFPKVGQKQKTEKKKKREREKEERKLVITMAKLRMAHASRLGQQENLPNYITPICTNRQKTDKQTAVDVGNKNTSWPISVNILLQI